MGRSICALCAKRIRDMDADGWAVRCAHLGATEAVRIGDGSPHRPEEVCGWFVSRQGIERRDKEIDHGKAIA